MGMHLDVARLKMLAKCCRIGVLSYISQLIGCMEPELVVYLPLQPKTQPLNHRLWKLVGKVRYRIGILFYSILPAF